MKTKNKLKPAVIPDLPAVTLNLFQGLYRVIPAKAGIYRFRIGVRNDVLKPQHDKKVRVHPLRSVQSRALKVLILLLVLGVSTAAFLYLTTSDTSAEWFNDNWAYRQKIVVTNNTTDETDVYVAFDVGDVLDTSDSGKYQDDCGDIRFTTQNGQILDYVINSGCGTSSTDIDVLMDSFPAGAQNIYMYYGNPAAEDGFETIDAVSTTSFVDGASGSTASGRTVSIAKADISGLADDDYVVVALSQDNDTGGNWTLSGWTFVSQKNTIIGRDTNTALAYKHISDVSSEPTTWDFALTTTTEKAAAAIAIRNVDTSSPIDATVVDTEGTNDSTPDADDITTSTDGAMVVSSHNAADPATNPYTGGAPSELTLGGSANGTNGDTSFSQIAYAVDSTAGSFTIGSWTTSPDNSTAEYHTKTIAFAPGASSAGTFDTEATNYTIGTPASEEITEGPMAYYKFDEGVDNTCSGGTNDVCDSTDQGYDGAITNDVAWQNEEFCVVGKCVYFDGTGDFVDIGTGPASVKSVSFWVRPTTTSEHFIDLNGSAYISASSGTLSATGFTSPTIYINGQVSSTIVANEWQYITVTTGTGVNATDFDIGRLESTDDFAGFMDEVKVYPYARTAEEVKTDFLNTAQGAGAVLGIYDQQNLNDGLKVYLPMNESSANTCTGGTNDNCDASGNGNDGAWSGNATNGVGKYGPGVTLDGTGDYIETGDIDL